MKHRIPALALAAALALTLAPATSHAAPPRDRLGKGCTWSKNTGGYFYQYCKVYSKAMDRNIPIEVRRGFTETAPVVMMLDGARANPMISDWIGIGKIQKTIENIDATFVFPAGGKASFYSDWDKKGGTPYQYKWETFMSRELPQYLKTTFAIQPVNFGVMGISMGAHAAVRLASQYPKLYTSVAGISGIYNIGYYGANMMIQDVYENATADDMYPKGDDRWAEFNIGSKAGASKISPRIKQIVLTTAKDIPNSGDKIGVYLEQLAKDDTASTARLYKSLGLPVKYIQVGRGVHDWPVFMAEFRYIVPGFVGKMPKSIRIPAPKKKPAPKPALKPAPKPAPKK